ncbi:MAG: type I-E CRISPR-associated endoribonuclease Cas2 [Candidatus Eisenbacteria sp.]|nr:type I-E CRISPR-associated endoribonuclease Cas2 [Candidatus Eisenbacteria bacterium]
MTVIVANDTPPAIRGLLKRWFIEPRPNVFVGTVNRRTRENVLQYVLRNAPKLGLLVIVSHGGSQGFEIQSFGDTNRKPVRECGLHLVAEAWREQEGGEE